MTITKASVFIRKVGDTDSAAAFHIATDNHVAFSVANFSAFTQGNNYALYDPIVSDATHSGCMRIFNTGQLESYPSFSYPVIAENAGKYYIFLRVKLIGSEDNFSVNIFIDDIYQNTINATLPLNEWVNVYGEIVVKDNKKFKLSVQPAVSDCYLDTIVISKDYAIPSSLNFDYQFCTLHARLFELNQNKEVVNDINFYDYKTNLQEIITDDWYNFEMKPLFGSSAVNFTEYYAFALFVAGSSDSQYLIWDYAENQLESDTCILNYNTTTQNWNIDCSEKFAIRYYSNYDPIDVSNQQIIVPPAKTANNDIQSFAGENLQPTFLQSEIVAIDEQKNKVALRLPSRLISIIIDQSGSQTWNDNTGLRHSMTRRMIDRLEATYPGEIKYNLVTFGATPIELDFFAVVESEQVNTSNVAAVASSFFADQESGYAGIRIVRKLGSYPETPLDGDIISEGLFRRAIDEDLTTGTEYFYAAYTYNSDGVFSDGKFLKVTPREKILPQGAGNFTYRVVTGTGVRRDDNTVGLWHCNEEDGSKLFDFADSNIVLTSNKNDLIWLEATDVPQGTSGLRLDGSTYFYGLDTANKLYHKQFTIMAWVYPYNFLQTREIVSRENPANSKTSFVFGVNSDGYLYLTLDTVTYALSSTALLETQWQHVAVTVDIEALIASFYIDGQFAGTASVTSGTSHTDLSANFYVGGRNAGFFGKITEVSIHNIIRSENYINSYSIIPSSNAFKILDNGDRLLILKYLVSDDFNYAGGNNFILRKEAIGVANFDYQEPTATGAASEIAPDAILSFNGFGEHINNEYDGVIVHDNSAIAGEKEISLPFNYVHDRKYFYRLFSKNAIGNTSTDSASPEIEITIPPFENTNARNLAIPTPSLPSMTNVQVIAGNAKTYITWDTVDDPNVAQIKVFWSDKGQIIIDEDSQVSKSAVCVFSGSPDATGFVDRNIENGITSYYALVTADSYGNFSEPLRVEAVPAVDADESLIPLLEVKNFRYEILRDDAISLAWDSPVKFQKDVEAYFDERIIIYAQITDEFGSPLVDVSNIKLNVEASIDSAEIAPDVFNENIVSADNFTVTDTYSISSTVLGSGIIKGIFRMTTSPDILSNINYLKASITVSYTIPDRNDPTQNIFILNSLPIRIRMYNPFAMEIVNVGANTYNYGDPLSSNTLVKKSRRRNSKTLQNVLVEENNTDNSALAKPDLVRIFCKQTVPLDDPGFIASGGTNYNAERYKDFDGCYIRRRRPYVARVVVTYKNQPLPQGASCNVAVFEASTPQCDPDEDESVNPCAAPDAQTTKPPFTPTYSSVRSRSVRPPETSIEFNLGRQELSDGSIRFVSYVDIPLQAPSSPQAVMFFAKANFAYLNARRKSYIVFANILKIETSIEPPQANCVDVAEQFANVFLIDPDSNDPLKPNLNRIPTDVPVKWELKQGFGAKNRPFYSSDNVPTGPGIFSYARNGTARKVFFGPACGVEFSLYRCNQNVLQLPELYAVRASVVYDGLRDFEERPAIIYPLRANTSGFGDRFLLSLPDYYNALYADGYSYIKGTIYHNPYVNGGSFGQCFLQCAENAGRTIFSLNGQQLVDLDSGDAFEIFYGDDIVIEYDEVLEEFLIKNGTQAFGFAQIPLSSTNNYTDFYLRINKFIPQTQEQSYPSRDNTGKNVNICSCVELPAGLLNKQNLPFVRGSTTINFDGDLLYLRAGGDFRTGIPPTAIDLREPLAIFIKAIRRNGVTVEDFLCDGISIHEIVVEVSFKEKPVPNGTPVFVTVGGKNPERIILQDDVVYTEKKVDLQLENLGIEKSYASVFILPISNNTSFESQVQVVSNYDKRGDTERTASSCITIKFDASVKQSIQVEELQNEINNIYDSKLEVFDTFNNTWTNKSSMLQARGCLSLTHILDVYGESLCATGGMNGKFILADTEIYDIASDLWIKKSPMNVPRFYHMSIFDGNYVYVFGGITVKENNLEITRVVERYDVSADSWEIIGAMPIFDRNPYGVAMGSALVINSKVYIVGGITRIGVRGSIDALNDRILVFDLDEQTWTYSNNFIDLEYDIYCRIAPFAYVSADATSIHIVGGSIPSASNNAAEQTLNFPTDSIRIDVDTFQLYIDDNRYAQLPKLRYRGATASIVDQHYFLGGTSKKQNVTNINELISEGLSVNSYQTLASMPTPKTSFGCVSDGLQYIYVAGGLNSGRPPGFIQIKTDINPINVRLDGKQSATLKIELLNDIGERPTNDIRVLVQGILLFPDAQADNATGGDVSQQQSANSALRDSLIYPVVFSNYDLTVQNGVGSTILLPRSDDILKKVSEIKKSLGLQTLPGESGSDGIGPLIITEGSIRYPYKIQIRLTIIDSFYYGQTVVDVKDNEDEAVVSTNTNPTQVQESDGERVINTGIETAAADANQIIFAGCTLVTANNIIPASGNDVVPPIGQPQENRRVIDRSLQETDNPVFDLNPPQSPQFSSPEVTYYSDMKWLPQSKVLLQEANYEEVYEKLRIISNEIPFGASPLLDCLQGVAEISSSESLDPYIKSFYINTDNEQNMSFATLDEAIESIQAIDGYGKVPCIINNFSVVFPITLSALVSRTDLASLEKLANQTGGQSQTILDEETISIVLNNSIGRLQGSIGYGAYECLINLGGNNLISDITAEFELYSNTDGNWAISTSQDGYSFTEYSDTYGPNEVINFVDLNAQFVKFKVTLLSGLSASIDDEYELVPTPGVPALTRIKIGYSEPTVSYIYLNQENLIHSAQQIAVAVSANKPKLSTIEIGATTGDTYSWIDYNSNDQNVAERFGKIFIPIRYNQTHDNTLNEPLDYVNGFVFRARYGRWDHSSSVYVYNKNGNQLDIGLYDAYPQEGVIVFKQRYTEPLTIGIENAGRLRIGLRITNKDAQNSVKIDGLGYMYNTNVFLPPALSQRAPTLSDFKIIPSELFIYQKISLTYKYFDINNDAEITEDAEIKWYINGVEVEFLRNLRTWNDINNLSDPLWLYGFTFKASDVPSTTTVELYARERGDSILKVDDVLYATIRVTDGNAYSNLYRSQAIKVIANPPIITSVAIKGLNNNGQLQDAVTATTRAVADFGFFADEKTRDKQKSQIVWYVNGVEFKRGNLNETVNGISNNQIIQGETVNNTVGITFGNSLQVIITPIANDIIGVPVSSEVVTVQNDPPRVSNVVLSPNPRASASSSLRVTYSYTDRESQQTGSQQSNQSSTRWYRAVRGSNTFEEVVALQNATIITSVNLATGQKWKVEVIPFDGFDTGQVVASNIVEIV